MSRTIEPHAKVGSCSITRRKLTRKRSLYGVNEHFEEVFNAVRGCEATFAYSSIEIEIDASDRLHPLAPLPFKFAGRALLTIPDYPTRLQHAAIDLAIDVFVQ
uniref:Uncharacterized protein n=1 Tax=Candidatus Kentrum sp. DK TaxID=2126562 RepID=A0A450T2D4_9GAMM|nr:MAG: hypothetical protein BECKDK2373B_GA0170837_109416 [Candidatus Kentron sp. DK]